MADKDYQDIVLSSRIRIARNVATLPFPHKISKTDAMNLVRDVYATLSQTDSYNLLKMSDIIKLDGEVLKEKHLISDDLLAAKETGAVIINDAETVSVMVNEEDHLRVQSILKGLSLSKAYSIAQSVDETLSKRIRFSFDERLGFLTACPTNLGTGMRASAMVFLPGLFMLSSIDSCISAISRLNMTIRGVYGEGSDISGCIFQVSNQKTLGQSEQEIIEAVNSSILHIVEAEYRARKLLFERSQSEITDKIARAYGVLTHAYKISADEFMQLIALVKLGVYYGIITLTDKDRLTSIETNIQPANISALAGRELKQEERDVYRAGYVSKVLKSIAKYN